MNAKTLIVQIEVNLEEEKDLMNMVFIGYISWKKIIEIILYPVICIINGVETYLIILKTIWIC